MTLLEVHNEQESIELFSLISSPVFNDFHLIVISLNARWQIQERWRWLYNNRPASTTPVISPSNPSSNLHHVYIDHELRMIQDTSTALHGFACHYREKEGKCANLPDEWIVSKIFWLGSQPYGSCVVLVSYPSLEFEKAMMQCGRIDAVLLEMNDGVGKGVVELNKQRGVLQRQFQTWWHQNYIKEGSSYWIALSRWSWVWSVSDTVIEFINWNPGYPNYVSKLKENSCLFLNLSKNGNTTGWQNGKCSGIQLDVVCEVINDASLKFPMVTLITKQETNTVKNQTTFKKHIETTSHPKNSTTGFSVKNIAVITVVVLILLVLLIIIIIIIICIYQRKRRARKKVGVYNENYILTSSSFYSARPDVYARTHDVSNNNKNNTQNNNNNTNNHNAHSFHNNNCDTHENNHIFNAFPITTKHNNENQWYLNNNYVNIEKIIQDNKYKVDVSDTVNNKLQENNKNIKNNEQSHQSFVQKSENQTQHPRQLVQLPPSTHYFIPNSKVLPCRHSNPVSNPFANNTSSSNTSIILGCELYSELRKNK